MPRQPREVMRLVNYRRPFEMLDRLRPAQKKQVTRLTRQNKAGKPERLVGHEDWAPMELVDVLDVASGKVTHQLYLWSWGSGALFVHDTTERAGAIIQHGIDLAQVAPDLAFRTALADACTRAKPKLSDTVDFQLDAQPAPTPEDEAKADAAEAAAAYQRLADALGKSRERYRDYEALSTSQQKTIRQVFRTTHVGLLTSHHDLTELGMPPGIRLRSWSGHSPRTELEARAGTWPVWKWLLEVRAGRVKPPAAIAAITKSLGAAKIVELACMVCDPFYDYGLWGELLRYEGGVRLTGPAQVRMVKLLAGLVDAAGDDAAVALADRVRGEKVEKQVWSQARAAIAATALALRARRRDEKPAKQLAPLVKKAGALFARRDT